MNLIIYYEDNDFDEYGMYRNPVVFEDIQIQAYDRMHIEIYGSTIHEIAHSSHYYNMKTNDWYLPQSAEFYLLPKILKESYARGVQRYLSIKYYGNWSKAFYNNEYTGIFEDLEDANTSDEYCDRVSGITAPMAEKVLFESYSWNGFKNNLMKEYPNGTLNDEDGKVTYTTADMDALFKYWETGIGAECPDPSSSSVKPISSSVIPSSSSAIASHLTDNRDGKVYRITAIGTQIWMAENLNYNATGSKCYNDNTANCTTYGRLYGWSTAMALSSSCNSVACSGQVNAKHKGICPSGWHVPNNADWDMLMRYADGSNGTSSPYDSPTAGKYL